MELKITLERLYDINRNEKKSADLQQLDQNYLSDVQLYMQQKMKELQERKGSDNMFAMSGMDKVERELRSVQRTIREIYERREKKIIDMALNRSRTQSDIIDTSGMLSDETRFYDSILGNLDLYRNEILRPIFTSESTFDRVEVTPIIEEEPEEVGGSNDSFTVSDPELGVNVRFLASIPQFIWKDLKEYGPFKEGQEAKLSMSIAEALVKKGRAELIN
jgi:DNA replication initiation complex subunit (GINS family)